MKQRLARGPLVLLVFVMAATSSLVCANEPAPRRLALPDTVVGRRAAAFFAAFNSGEDDAMRAFEAANRAKSALERRSIDERIEQYHDLRADWGDLTVDGMFSSDELELGLGVNAEHRDDFLRFRFELEPDAPHGLLAIYIEGGGPRPRKAVAVSSPLMDAKMRGDTVERIAEVLEESYVFAEVGSRMAGALRTNLSAGQYADLDRAPALARRLTRDLRDICHDRHLRVVAGHFPRQSDSDVDESDDWWAKSRWENYGFERAERLAGNVGYLKLNEFNSSDDAMKTAAAAMNFLSNCSALIFDLRDNGGGSPEMIAFLSGYLFEKSVHLNSFYNRKEDEATETWSRTDVPGLRFGSTKPVYVLTSHHTFSAAEEFTYNLKHLKRATIVGETTGGGAHPIFRQRINDVISMTVPYARAINPITKTNWEGTGVLPDVKASARRALAVAHEVALEKLIEGTQDRERRREIERALRRVRASTSKDGGLTVKREGRSPPTGCAEGDAGE